MFAEKRKKKEMKNKGGVETEEERAKERDSKDDIATVIRFLLS